MNRPVGPSILLKARPTAAQLANRLRAPVPDGMELYIHEDDVSGDGWLPELMRRVESVAVTAGFQWIVEGPVWSLDGQLFDICRDSEVDRELVRRLVALSRALEAQAVNIHCVRGTTNVSDLTPDARGEALRLATPFLRWYVDLCQGAGLLPLIENVPPVCRMRRAAFVYTPIGVLPDDLLDCAAAAPGLGVTLDTSHAQLATNAFAGGPYEAIVHEQPDLARAAAYYHSLGGPSTLAGYVEAALPAVISVHVSNASGILAEGLPYGEGDASLDSIVRQMAPSVRYFVTEPIDVDENTAPLKRDMQARLAAVLRRDA